MNGHDAFGISKGRYVPTPDQLAMSQARKVAQQAEKVRLKRVKMNTRTGQRKVGWREHREAMGRTPEGVAAATLGGGGGLYLLNRKTRVEKADKEKNIALGATSGALLGGAANNVVAQGMKITLKERRAKRGQSPREAQSWAAHKKKYPSTSPEPFLSVTRDGKKLNVKMRPNKAGSYMNYPKDLPDWKGQRALAQVARPRAVAATIGAGGVAGGVYGAKRSKR